MTNALLSKISIFHVSYRIRKDLSEDLVHSVVMSWHYTYDSIRLEFHFFTKPSKTV